MFLPILTLTLCLTTAYEYDSFEETTKHGSYANESLYNIYDYVKELQLERCSLVAIGLKYFAIFIEDGIVSSNLTNVRKKYFLGICHQTTLEEWSFCSPSLSEKRKYKCKFKLNSKKFQSRVHRRFCDISIMVNNKDCQCESTIFGDEMFKVKGFPTCYIPPLPDSLCKYNVCGLSKCQPTTTEKRVHTVQCDAKCRGGYPFCEHPLQRTSTTPVVSSLWSEWSLAPDTESLKTTGKKRSLAACINQYTRQGDIDCLGPSTGCCHQNLRNCSCNTFEERGTLKVERIIYAAQRRKQRTKELPTLTSFSYYNSPKTSPRISITYSLNRHSHVKRTPKKQKNAYRYLRDTDEDIEDDDEDDAQDLDEDIVLEENVEGISTVLTTEELEREDALKELRKKILEEENETLVDNIEKTTTKNSNLNLGKYCSHIVIIVMLSSLLLINFR